TACIASAISSWPGRSMLRGLTTAASGDASDISFFTNIFRDAKLPSIIIGPDSTVLFWNRAAERLFGWSSQEVLGRTLPLVPTDRMEEHHRIRQRSLTGEGFSQERITRLTKDGRQIEVSLSTWPIRDAHGNVTAIIGIFSEAAAEEL